MHLSNKENPSICIVVLAIGLILYHHFFYFYGHFGYDDMHYARLSHQLLQGDINWADHYSFRFTVLGSTALSYSLFGINDFSSGLPALVLTFGVIGIFYSIFSQRPLLLITTLAVYFSYKWNLFYADKLMPDLYVSSFSLLGWYGYYKYSTEDSKNYIFPFLSAVGIFLAFNSKGTIILLVPIFAYYLLKDIFNKSFEFWKLFIPAIVALLVGYFGLIKYYTGSALTRFESILSNQYVNDCSYDQLGLEVLLDRLGPQFINLLTSEGLYIPVLLIVISAIVKKVFSIHSESVFNYAATVLVLLLSVNFMSISLTSYNPICIDPRHIMFITPIIAICVSNTLGNFNNSNNNQNKYFIPALLIGSVLILVPTYNYANYCKRINYSEIRKSYLELANNENLEGTIICAPTLKNYIEYYSEFHSNNNRTYLPIDEANRIQANDPNLLIATNWYADWHAGMDGGKIQELAKDKGIQINDEIIFSNEHVVIRPVSGE